MISFSKHFISTDVRAIGLKSLGLMGRGFFGVGIIIDSTRKQLGITHHCSERLNMSGNTGTN